MTRLMKKKAGLECFRMDVEQTACGSRKRGACRGLAGLLLPFMFVVCLALTSCLHCTNGGWREYKVFCGMSFKDGEVTEADWRRFCDEHVTTAFPDGYTSFEAIGCWKGSAAVTERENSRVLIIVAPADAKDKVLSIAKQYRERFHQEAVLVMTSQGEAIFVEDGQ